MNKVVVLDYEDNARGTMEEGADGGGRFIEVTLQPLITVTAESDLEVARRLHHEAHENASL